MPLIVTEIVTPDKNRDLSNDKILKMIKEAQFVFGFTLDYYKKNKRIFSILAYPEARDVPVMVLAGRNMPVLLCPAFDANRSDPDDAFVLGDYLANSSRLAPGDFVPINALYWVDERKNTLFEVLIKIFQAFNEDFDTAEDTFLSISQQSCKIREEEVPQQTGSADAPKKDEDKVEEKVKDPVPENKGGKAPVYDFDDVDEMFCTVLPEKPDRKGARNFFSEYKPYTLREHLISVKQNVKADVWTAIGKVSKLFQDSPTAVTAQDLQTVYQTDGNTGVVDLMIGGPTIFSQSYAEAEKAPIDEKAKSISEMRELDTLSSRLPQAAEGRGTVLKVSPSSRTGELDVYANLFSAEQPLMFTSPPSVPVAQAKTNEFNTLVFTKFIEAHANQFSNSIPKVLWLTHELNDKDIDILADVIQVGCRKEKGTFAIGFGTQGGALYDDEKAEKLPRFKLDPLAYALGQGLPFIYLIKNAYNYDADFRKHWDEKQSTKLMERQKQHKDQFDNFINASIDFYSCIVPRKVDPQIAMSPVDLNDSGTPLDTYHTLVDEFHHNSRQRAKLEFVEQGVFTSQGHLNNIMPNDTFAITVVNDLLFDGYDIEFYDSLGFCNVGRMVGEKCTTVRPPVGEKDKLSEVPAWLYKKFDQRSGGKGRVVLDLRMVHKDGERPKSLFVGSGKWSQMILSKGEGETRNEIYYDYEDVESKRSNKTKDFVHERPTGVDHQLNHALKLCDRLSTDLDYVGCLVPYRALPVLLQKYKKQVLVALKAPFPAEASAYVIVSKKPLQKPVTLEHCYLLVYMQLNAIWYSMAVYKSGYWGFGKLMDYKMQVATSDYFGNTFMYWHQKMVSRFVDDSAAMNTGSSKLKIEDKQDRLLKTDKRSVRLHEIQAVNDRRDRDKNRFAVKKTAKKKEEKKE